MRTLAASTEAIEVTLETYTKKSSLDKSNFIHFVFIFAVVLSLSFVSFDLTKDDERSFVFSLLLILCGVYSTGSFKLRASKFLKTTDYTPSTAFAIICLSWWVALTDFFIGLDQTSRFSGFFLALSLLFTFVLMLDFVHFFSEKARKPITAKYVIRIGQIVLLVTLGAMFYFFINGNWDFHLGGPFDFLSRVMRG
ncbi:hypothetical protein AltI4_37800 [Alteromonas sp. I4]|nr:hypothetical protein AltI4_37800 [Alteromonas sp. I4]